MDEEELSRADTDPKRRGHDLVGHAPGGGPKEHALVEGVAQAEGGDPARLVREGKKGDKVAHVPLDLHAVHHEVEAGARVEKNDGHVVFSEEVGVGEGMVQTGAEGAHDKDPLGPEGHGVVQGELKVGGVLLAGDAKDGKSRGRGEREGVEVAQKEIHGKAGALGQKEAAVGRKDEVRLGRGEAGLLRGGHAAREDQHRAWHEKTPPWRQPREGALRSAPA